jgi:hypothetical protein
MEGDELVDTALVGFDRRETVTIHNPASERGPVERIRRYEAVHGPECQSGPRVLSQDILDG